MSDSKFSVNQIDVDGLSNDPTMQANLGNSTLVLNDITDVIVAGSPLVTDQVLKYNGTNWVNAVDVSSNNWLTANNGADFATAPIATGANSLALGDSATTAATNNSIAIGDSANVTAFAGIAIGFNCSASFYAITLGRLATASANYAISIGPRATATAFSTIAIGSNSDATFDRAIAIGNHSDALALDAIAIGNTTVANATNAIAIGEYATASGNHCLSIGDNSDATTPYATAIGNLAQAAGTGSVALGYKSNAPAAGDVCIGREAINSTTGSKNVIIGLNSFVKNGSTGYNVVIGNYAGVDGSVDSIVVAGTFSVVKLTKQVAVGSSLVDTSVTSDVAYSVKLGYGAVNANKNMLHLYSKGKLELYGDEAQYIFPSYVVTGSPIGVPANAIEGGVIYDSIAKGLQLYDGTSWSAIGAGASALNDLTDVTLGSPVTTNEVLKFDGSNWVNADDIGLFAEDANDNVYGGTGTGSAFTSGNSNFLGGFNAGQAITTGASNVIVGYQALNTASNPQNSVAIGKSALGSALSPTNMTAIGVLAGENVGSASNCTFVGNNAGQNNDAVASNTFIGNLCGRGVGAATDGDGNTALGREALNVFTSGANNVALGYLAGVAISVGASNTIVGKSAGTQITSGTLNVCLGTLAGPTVAAPTASNKLYIDVTETDTPLIGGDFGTNIVTINGKLVATGGVDALTTATTVVDVATAAAPTNGQVLTATSSTAATWQTPTTPTTALNDLTDVAMGSPVTDQALTYDGTNWVNLTPPYVNKTGDTMTGTLVIGDGTDGRTLIIKGTGSDPLIRFRTSADLNTGLILSDQFDNKLIFENINPSNSTVYTTLTLDTTGNVSVEDGGGGSPVTNVPTLVSHLTRKDYVDSLVVFTEFASGSIVGGTSAGAALTAGALSNLIIGVNAGSSLDFEDYNVIIGNDALVDSVNSLQNVDIGVSAAQYADLSACVVMGYQAMQGVFTDDILTSSSVAIGHRAGQYSDGADFNVLVGRNAGSGTITDRMTGGQLTYIGYTAGLNTSTGSNGTAVGYQAMQGTATTPLTGGSNVAVGSRALYIIEGAANQNVAIGRDTLDVLTTGNQNTALGYNAGATITTGAGNVMLGYLAGPATNQSNKLFIDNSQTDTPLIGGDFSANTVTIGGTLNLVNNDVDNVKTVTFNSEVANVPTGSPLAETIDWTAGQKQKITITAATSITFTAPVGPCNLTLKIVNGGTGTITWPATVKWPGGSEPSWTTSGTDIASFYFDGTDYYGMSGLAFA